MINIPVKESYGVVKDIIKQPIKIGNQLVKYIGKKRRRDNSGKAVAIYKAPKAMPGLFTQHGSKILERKYIDQGWAGIFMSDTISKLLINGVDEGTGVGQRIGRRLENRTVSIRANIVSAADFSSVKCRILLVVDRQPNGTAMTASDLLENSTYPHDSFYALKNRDRFLVLKDQQFIANPVDSAKTQMFKVNWGISLRKIPTTYQGTGQGITDIMTNAIWLIVCSGAANAGANTTKPTFNTLIRYRYYDA